MTVANMTSRNTDKAALSAAMKSTSTTKPLLDTPSMANALLKLASQDNKEVLLGCGLIMWEVELRGRHSPADTETISRETQKIIASLAPSLEAADFAVSDKKTEEAMSRAIRQLVSIHSTRLLREIALKTENEGLGREAVFGLALLGEKEALHEIKGNAALRSTKAVVDLISLAPQ